MSKVNPLNLAPFDVSDYLDSEKLIAEYLGVALANPDYTQTMRIRLSCISLPS